MLDKLLKETEDKMDKAVQVTEHELQSLRTGRASVHLLDGITVPMYGTENPINQIATVSTPDASTIMIQPWDQSALPAIEKAILQANIGLTPSNDGRVIRLNIPPMTEESRKTMVKRAHEIAEEGRIAVRNVRRHANDDVKKSEKSNDITEDESKRLHDQIQKKTDQHVERIDNLLKKKEEEIMTV